MEPPIKYSAKTGNSILSSRKYYKNDSAKKHEHVMSGWVKPLHNNREQRWCVKNIGHFEPANWTWEYSDRPKQQQQNNSNYPIMYYLCVCVVFLCTYIKISVFPHLISFLWIRDRMEDQGWLFNILLNNENSLFAFWLYFIKYLKEITRVCA